MAKVRQRADNPLELDILVAERVGFVPVVLSAINNLGLF
jgi:hypothetical protein